MKRYLYLVVASKDDAIADLEVVWAKDAAQAKRRSEWPESRYHLSAMRISRMLPPWRWRCGPCPF